MALAGSHFSPRSPGEKTRLRPSQCHPVPSLSVCSRVNVCCHHLRVRLPIARAIQICNGRGGWLRRLRNIRAGVFGSNPIRSFQQERPFSKTTQVPRSCLQCQYLVPPGLQKLLCSPFTWGRWVSAGRCEERCLRGAPEQLDGPPCTQWPCSEAVPLQGFVWLETSASPVCQEELGFSISMLASGSHSSASWLSRAGVAWAFPLRFHA